MFSKKHPTLKDLAAAERQRDEANRQTHLASLNGEESHKFKLANRREVKIIKKIKKMRAQMGLPPQERRR